MTILARRISLFVILMCGIGSTPLCAQVQAINGSIQGDVTDSRGALVPSADVEADEVDTAIVHRTVTDGSGHFEFLSLQPGRYVVKISKAGFATTIQENLNLTVGRTVSLKLTLQVAGASESIVVNSAPMVDIVTSTSNTTLGEQTVATTPVLGAIVTSRNTCAVKRPQRPGSSIRTGNAAALFALVQRSGPQNTRIEISN